MSLPTMQGIARLIEDPELRFAASGTAVVKVRLAFNSRKKDANGEWVDSDSFFVDGTAFGQMAESVAESLVKGLEVVVSGRLRTERWETKQGEKRSGVALLVDSIGPSLRSATARVEKASRGGAGGQGQQQGGGARSGGWGGGQGPAQDAWSSGGGQQGGWGGGDEPPF